MKLLINKPVNRQSFWSMNLLTWRQTPVRKNLSKSFLGMLQTELVIQIWILRICMFLDLLDPYPDLSLFVQILPSSSNNCEKIHVFYCFVNSLWLFYLLTMKSMYLQEIISKTMWEIKLFFVKVWHKEQDPEQDLDLDLDPQVIVKDIRIWIRIRIHTKMLKVQNTGAVIKEPLEKGTFWSTNLLTWWASQPRRTWRPHLLQSRCGQEGNQNSQRWNSW